MVPTFILSTVTLLSVSTFMACPDKSISFVVTFSASPAPAAAAASPHSNTFPLDGYFNACPSVPDVIGNLYVPIVTCCVNVFTPVIVSVAVNETFSD